ncbi:MAG: DUF58 domain-containing protein [Actinomycetia bacterium]|nr:DUF58 domain-containing protein [Actinomycetes bacterium]MCP4087818.1 DUF58 domain-containing protein [Actinomycetes bacterium]
MVTRRLDGYLQGDYRGLIAGHGTELGETRQYQAGDDVRRIDWNVTARMGEPHIRDTIADRELETWVLLDRSPSLDFGTALMEKSDLAFAATAAIGFLTARAGNRIGFLMAGTESTASLPARSGRRHLQALLHRASSTPRATEPGSIDLTASIRALATPHRPRGLAVVISDFLAPAGWDHELRRLATRHEVLAIEVVDPRELELPNVGLLVLEDPETGRRRTVQTGSAKLRQRYAEAAANQRDTIAHGISGAGASHLRLRTDRDWLGDIIRWVETSRRARGRR